MNEQNRHLCVPCRAIVAGAWSRCTRFPDPLVSLRKRYDFHGTLGTIRDCVKSFGCPICKVALMNGQWEDLASDTEMTFLWAPGHSYLLVLEILPGSSNPEYPGKGGDASFVTLERLEKAQVDQILRPMFNRSTFSTAGLDFLRKKLLTCLDTHRLCNASKDPFVPTRVIDVNGGLRSSVRLVEWSSQESKQDYATLSHCWGGSQVVTLTTINKERFLRGVSIASLPLTFQHAIAVVRLLGIRYLWIDSLCIVQDSAADWEVESSLMVNVYGHGGVNIAATSSSSSAGGLFFDRDPDIVQPFAVYSPGREDLKLQAGWYAWTNDGRWDSLAHQPLNQRAWVLQERLLSKRTAHFTASEVVWQCLEDLSSETMPEQLDTGRLAVPLMQIGDYTDMKIAIARARCDGLTTQLKDQILYEWLGAIGHYSTCGLTVDSDKLVAIDGMARQLSVLTGDEFLAGLWRSQLPACLLWSVARRMSLEPEECVTRKITPEELQRWKLPRWRAPSWSWASHNLPIRFRRDWAECDWSPATVIHAEVTRMPNGSIVSANLRLRSPVIRVQVDLALDSRHFICGWCSGSISGLVEGALHRVAVEEFGVEMDGPLDSKSMAELHAALLLRGQDSFFFVLLCPTDCNEAEARTFRRIGTLRVPIESSSRDQENLLREQREFEIV